MRFDPAHLDLGRLQANVAQRDAELAQYETIVAGLEPGTDREAWQNEIVRVRSELDELETLIETKEEFDREQKETG